MRKRFDGLPEWEFEIDEVSAGVYRVVAHDLLGHKVSFTGVDPDALVEECRSAIAQLPEASLNLTSTGDPH
jgi:pimeloyl-ACP methyl ester carboxylesterase